MIEQVYILNSSSGGLGGSGGLKMASFTDLDSTGMSVFSTPPGGIAGWNITNVGPGDVYVKFYDVSSAPVIGVDTPIITLGIPADSTSELLFSSIKNFVNGAWIRATTGVADNDITDPATNQVVGSVFYIGT